MSKRNGNVTRWRVTTVYMREWFSAKDRKIHKEKFCETGKLTENELWQLNKKRLTEQEALVDVKIIGYDKSLYAMPEDEFYQKAKIIATDAVTI